jgi:hypothetical protein
VGHHACELFACWDRGLIFFVQAGLKPQSYWSLLWSTGITIRCYNACPRTIVLRKAGKVKI